MIEKGMRYVPVVSLVACSYREIKPPVTNEFTYKKVRIAIGGLVLTYDFGP